MSRLAPLALLAALAPSACLSGFSEIRVQGGGADASSDRPLPDVAPARDAAEDRAQLADADDATTLPEAAVDVPDVATPADLGAPEDVAVDAGPVDASGDVAGDTGPADVPEDRPEPPDVQSADAGAATDPGGDAAAADVVDAGACPGGCGAGEVCERGRCGRWRFVLAIALEASDQQRYGASPAGIDTAGAEVCAFIARGRPVRACRRGDLAPAEVAPWCMSGLRRTAIGDADLVRMVGGAYVPGCALCREDASVPAMVDGEGCGNWPPTIACCAFE